MRSGAVVLACVVLAAVAGLAQPPTANDAISRDRANRQAAVKAGRAPPAPPQRGFFGTIFHLIVDSVNDTKSAYRQISDMFNSQFTDDDEDAAKPPESGNGTEAKPKISRAKILRILALNLEGLRRLRELEWREAMKDSRANIRAYKEEAQGIKPNG